MEAENGWGRCLWVGCAIAILLYANAAVGLPDAMSFRPVVSLVSMTAGMASGLAPVSHRLTTRVGHIIDRFLLLLGDVGAFWLWVVLSTAVFVTVAMFASVIDARMFALRREPPGAVARYLGYGIRTFFLIVLDRRTPYTARAFLALALVYWLVPFDLIADKSLVPGFLDDLVVTVVAAKGFVYFCPGALVAEHAQAVEARARRRRGFPKPPRLAARH
jgi:uncharacterized membrane protein YkvA (DUF1232 family)